MYSVYNIQIMSKEFSIDGNELYCVERAGTPRTTNPKINFNFFLKKSVRSPNNGDMQQYATMSNKKNNHAYRNAFSLSCCREALSTQNFATTHNGHGQSFGANATTRLNAQRAILSYITKELLESKKI